VIRKKPAPHMMRDVPRFSGKIMRKQERRGLTCPFPP
jgi:hypothetical protein